jgi:hypothetical protein
LDISNLFYGEHSSVFRNAPHGRAVDGGQRERWIFETLRRIMEEERRDLREITLVGRIRQGRSDAV